MGTEVNGGIPQPHMGRAGLIEKSSSAQFCLNIAARLVSDNCMKRLWAAFREWLIEVWDFVPREDYESVQYDHWGAEREVERLGKENYDLMDSMYSRKYSTFEELVDVPLETIHVYHIDVREKEFAWSVRIPHQRLDAMFDPKQEMDQMKRYVLARLSDAFKQNIGKQLFGEQHGAQT